MPVEVLAFRQYNNSNAYHKIAILYKQVVGLIARILCIELGLLARALVL